MSPLNRTIKQILLQESFQMFSVALNHEIQYARLFNSSLFGHLLLKHKIKFLLRRILIAIMITYHEITFTTYIMTRPTIILSFKSNQIGAFTKDQYHEKKS